MRPVGLVGCSRIQYVHVPRILSCIKCSFQLLLAGFPPETSHILSNPWPCTPHEAPARPTYSNSIQQPGNYHWVVLVVMNLRGRGNMNISTGKKSNPSSLCIYWICLPVFAIPQRSCKSLPFEEPKHIQIYHVCCHRNISEFHTSAHQQGLHVPEWQASGSNRLLRLPGRSGVFIHVFTYMFCVIILPCLYWQTAR